MMRKRVNQNPKKTLLVVTATEAESLYFSQMRKDCRYTNMTVRWAEDATDLESLISSAAKIRTAGKFDATWCVFGFSDLNATPEQVKAALALADKKKVKLAWNNPGLAIWYLLHIQAPRQPLGDIALVESSLRGHFPKFSTSASYLLNEGNSLHLKLFPAKAQAVVNAGAYNSTAEKRFGGLPATNMTKLINEITDYCGLADVSHNQKLIGLKNS
jgi:hypothetical protein